MAAFARVCVRVCLSLHTLDGVPRVNMRASPTTSLFFLFTDSSERSFVPGCVGAARTCGTCLAVITLVLWGFGGGWRSEWGKQGPRINWVAPLPPKGPHPHWLWRAVWKAWQTGGAASRRYCGFKKYDFSHLQHIANLLFSPKAAYFSRLGIKPQCVFYKDQNVTRGWKYRRGLLRLIAFDVLMPLRF